MLDVPEIRMVPKYNLALALRAGRPNLYFADLKDALCAGQKCAVILNGKSLYHDNSHRCASIP